MVVIVRLSKFSGPRQKVWMESIQKRVNVTSSMLESVKGVKMLGITERMHHIIQRLRIDELAASKKWRLLQISLIGIHNAPFSVAPVLTFAVYSGIAIRRGETLDPAKAFTSLSILALLNMPLSTLLYSWPQFKSAMAGFERVQAFILKDSRQDNRLVDLPSPRPISSIQPTLQRRGVIEEIELAKLPRSVKGLSYNEVISIQDGEFGWKKDEVLLKDISMSMLERSMTMIVGPVGSGKSTLLKSILGEALNLKGFIRVATLDFSFCDQTSWIVNGTIQENILGQSSFESDWYEQVIYACSMVDDLRRMPEGDMTIVGSSGITLSGGQKQRIAIARAVYARKPIALFDDIFSGLDAKNEARVFARVFGPNGLLRRNGTTVALVTHSVRWLSFADQVVALSSDGKIVESGTFEQLVDRKGYVYELSLRRQAKSDEEEAPLPLETKARFGRKENAVMAEDLSRRTGDLSVYGYWARTIGWQRCLVYVAYLALGAFANNFPSILLNWWSAENTIRPNHKIGMYLGFYVLLAVTGVMCIVLGCLQLFIYMVPRSAKTLHEIVLSTVLNAPMSFFTETDTGTTTNRFSQDMQLVDVALPAALVNCSFELSQTIAATILTATATSYMGAIVPFAAGFLYFLQKYYLKTSRQLRFLDLEAKSPLYSHFLESLSGVATIRAFGWQRASKAKNIELLDLSQKPFYILYCIQRWLNLVLDIFVGVLAVIVMALAIGLNGKITGGYLGVALVNVIELNNTLGTLISQWTVMETSIGAVSRIKSFEQETDSEHQPQESLAPPEYWPSNPTINFSSLSASYSGDASTNVLKSVELKVPAGAKIGICGSSGSGKSSLLAALFRMLPLTDGSICIDNLDISFMPRDKVRSSMTALPQEPFFLFGSIRDNLDPEGLCSSSEEMESALRKVHLSHLLTSSAEGLDAKLDAKQMSHGQRQLFCLARALLKRRRSNFLILDEASSAMDSETDEVMQKLIHEEFSTCTVIAVAHRLDTIVDFDTVVYMEAGEVAEIGPPAELLLKEGGKFRGLYEAAGKSAASSEGSSDESL
jgi:ATP-binding cassette subfamily C (CFTR/MRP) protein 1